MRNDEREPLMSHIQELLHRLKRCLIYFMVAFGIGYALSEDVLKLVMVPIHQFLPPGVKLVFTQPFEQVFVLMKMSVIIGVIFAIPAFFAEIFFFLDRGLTARESRRIWTTFVGAWLLALAGVVWSYRYLLPLILDIVMSYQSLDVSPVISLSYYVNASLGLLLVGGLFFEIPFFMILASSWGWVPASFWSQQRRYAIVFNAVVSAVLSPPDLPSMLAMMIPIQVLYEIGYWGARIFSALRKPESGAEQSEVES